MLTDIEQQQHNREHFLCFCRGERKIGRDQLVAIERKSDALRDAGDLEGLKLLVANLNELLAVTLRPEDATSVGQWHLTVVRLLDVRHPCGENISELMGAPPYNQILRTIICPACGALHDLIPALSVEGSAALQASFAAKVEGIAT